MVSKTTQRISEVKAFSIFMLIASLFFSVNSFSQTITDVFPTRFTNGSKLTAIGSGFTGVVAGDILISNGVQNYPIDPASVVVVSDTEINFNIAASFPRPSKNDLVLTIGSGTAPDLIEYVKFQDKAYFVDSDITIDEVFTNWNYDGQGYYRSSWYDPLDDSTWPNNKHELLAFTVDGTTYSTGVDDAKLDDPNGDGNFIDAIPYTAQNFQAYSSNGVSGFPNTQSFLLMADEIDGVTNGSVLNNQVDATVYDVLIDGASGQGLDLGTGISNFNSEANIRFFSGNGIFGAVNDAIPDLIITQIAVPGGLDIYYYTDINGDIVGTPVRLRMTANNPSETDIYKWKLDLYLMNTSVPYEVSYPVGTAFGPNESRGFRMVALKLLDFNISTDPSSINYIGKINNVVAQGGGSADMAFLAYNKGAFEIKSPFITQFPLSRNVCKPNGLSDVTFSSLGVIQNPTGIPEETINYQWFRDFTEISGATSANYSVNNIGLAELGNYKVRISNEFGAVDLPVSIEEGGTPTFWNDATKLWELPPAFVTAGITVDEEERNLIFSDNYSENVDLEGCDCRVLRDQVVTIAANTTLKLYGEIIVEDELDVFNDAGALIETIPAGQITFDDDASLLQIKAVTTNENSGAINMERDATNLNTYDYVYWSSPVTDFDIANIPGAFPYQWSVNALNVNGTKGDWITASGVMKAGKGYIKRIPSAADFTTTFSGRPNNGVVNVDVFKSIGPNLPPVSAGSHWNLVGNPYPSAINATDFLLANTNIDGFVYLWTRGLGITNSPSSDPYYGDFVYNFGDEYLQSNGTGSTNPDFDGKIASGQAFFVQVLDTEADASNITFNNAMRYDGAENAYDNDEFFRSSNPETSSADLTLEKQLIWLALVNESNLSSIALIGYVDGATNGRDRMYDAMRTGENMNIYSVLEDTKMTIQGRSYPFDNSDTVALGVDLLEDGIYKIAIDHVQGSVFENETQGVYLEDTYLNVVHDLRASPYSFAGISGTTKDRFLLRYNADQQLSVADQNSLDTFIYIKEDRLYVKASNNIKSIVIYDVTGKQVVTYKLGANVSRSFNTQFQYPRGAYIGVINLDNNVAIAKKLIN